jgi:hypothetical protein
MSVDLLSINEEDEDQSHNIDMLLNLIGTNESDQVMDGVPNHNFPLEYDWGQPAKSWWRYFQKMTDKNTAMCYTCKLDTVIMGACFFVWTVFGEVGDDLSI